MTNIYIKYFVQKMGVKPKTQPLQYIQRVATVCYISTFREIQHSDVLQRTIQPLFVMTPISTFENWCCLLQKVCQLLQPSLTFTITCLYPTNNRAKKRYRTKTNVLPLRNKYLCNVQMFMFNCRPFPHKYILSFQFTDHFFQQTMQVCTHFHYYIELIASNGQNIVSSMIGKPSK